MFFMELMIFKTYYSNDGSLCMHRLGLAPGACNVKASYPTAVLADPVVSAISALYPIATLVLFTFMLL